MFVFNPLNLGNPLIPEQEPSGRMFSFVVDDEIGYGFIEDQMKKMNEKALKAMKDDLTKIAHSANGFTKDRWTLWQSLDRTPGYLVLLFLLITIQEEGEFTGLRSCLTLPANVRARKDNGHGHLVNEPRVQFGVTLDGFVKCFALLTDGISAIPDAAVTRILGELAQCEDVKTRIEVLGVELTKECVQVFEHGDASIRRRWRGDPLKNLYHTVVSNLAESHKRHKMSAVLLGMRGLLNGHVREAIRRDPPSDSIKIAFLGPEGIDKAALVAEIARRTGRLRRLEMPSDVSDLRQLQRETFANVAVIILFVTSDARTLSYYDDAIPAFVHNVTVDTQYVIVVTPNDDADAVGSNDDKIEALARKLRCERHFRVPEDVSVLVEVVRGMVEEFDAFVEPPD
jgi:hypothetical protein